MSVLVGARFSCLSNLAFPITHALPGIQPPIHSRLGGFLPGLFDFRL
jgi:hypothetical protein